ncbi:MAG: right-handed parallel beta-helix repeat-containing protein [Leeuwenhoekiella sp.]
MAKLPLDLFRSVVLFSFFLYVTGALAQDPGAQFCGPYTASGAISLSGISNQTISGLEISGITGNGIRLYNCNNIIIENNSINSCSGNGIELLNCTNVIIRNNRIEDIASGLYAVRSSGIQFTYNSVKNVNGPYPRGQMAQFNEVNGGINKVSHNISVNVLGESYPEDIINLYKSNGTAENPIEVKGNWIRGGGPSPNGGGIMTGDMGGSWVVVEDNILVDPGQYGIAIASGTNITINNNLVYGKQQSFTNVGIYAWEQYGLPCHSNTMTNNTSTFTHRDGFVNNSWIAGNGGVSHQSGNKWAWGQRYIDSTILPEVLIAECTTEVTETVKTYVYENGWSPNDPAIDGTDADNILIKNGTATLLADLTINNIEVESGSALEIGGTLYLNGNITNSGTFIFLDTATHTGQLAPLPESSTITGEIETHRYFKHRRAYRMVAPAVSTSTSINQNWQEGAASVYENPHPGYGTHISGSKTGANGFDETSTGNPSLFKLNVAAQKWLAIDNTDTNVLTSGDAYLVMVRGDRSTDLSTNTATPSTTILRTTGTLYTGTYEDTDLSERKDELNFVGNPYQCTIDLNKALANSENLNQNFAHVWDPLINVRGGYVTVSLADGSNNSLGASLISNYLQPGEAAFVRTATDGKAVFRISESDKAPSEIARREPVTTPKSYLSVKLMLENSNENPLLADATLIKFDQNADNSVTDGDALKAVNLDANLSISTHGKLLSIENRQLPKKEEIIHLSMDQLRHKNYSLVVEATGINTPIILHDRYLETAEILDKEINTLAFAIDPNNELSFAPDRFYFGFNTQSLGFTAQDEINDALRIFPNPVETESFTLTLPEKIIGDDLDITLYDITGRKVHQTALASVNHKIKIERPDLSSGTYILAVSSNQLEYTQKLILD